MVTKVYDFHTGGFPKTQYDTIYVNGTRSEAVYLVKEKLGIDIENWDGESATKDFYLQEYPDINEAVDSERGRQSPEDYKKRPDVLFI